MIDFYFCTRDSCIAKCVTKTVIIAIIVKSIKYTYCKGSHRDSVMVSLSRLLHASNRMISDLWRFFNTMHWKIDGVETPGMENIFLWFVFRTPVLLTVMTMEGQKILISN